MIKSNIQSIKSKKHARPLPRKILSWKMKFDRWGIKTVAKEKMGRRLRFLCQSNKTTAARCPTWCPWRLLPKELEYDQGQHRGTARCHFKGQCILIKSSARKKKMRIRRCCPIFKNAGVRKHNLTGTWAKTFHLHNNQCNNTLKTKCKYSKTT